MMKSRARYPLFYSALVAILLPLLCACGTSEQSAGMQLELALTHHYGPDDAGDYPAGNAADTPRDFTTADGIPVRLTRGYLTVYSVELVACATQTARGPAHDISSPTKLAIPHVLRLMRADDEPLSVGTLEPPPGDYCTARLVLEPADGDARELPEDVDMVGKTVHLEGTFQDSLGETSPFLLQSNGVVWVDVDLDAAPLEGVTLSESTPTAHLTLAFLYDQWLEGVALSSDAPLEQSDVLINAVAAAGVEAKITVPE